MTLILAPYIQCLKRSDKNLGCSESHRQVPAVTRCSCAASSWDNVWVGPRRLHLLVPFPHTFSWSAGKSPAQKKRVRVERGKGREGERKSSNICTSIQVVWSILLTLYPKAINQLISFLLFSSVLNWFHKPGDFSIVIWLWAFQFHDF